MKKTNIIGKRIGSFKFNALILAAMVVLVSAVFAGNTLARTKSAVPAGAGDVIAEWHREAIRLTILPASGLAPIRQARVMAIVQVSVHDAVNGLTRGFETYATPAPAPNNASPEAAAIAASYHALRTLFPTHAASLETLFTDSLAAHGLSVNDPGVGYGIGAASAILALRANDGSAQAQFPFIPPNAGDPGIWMPLAGQTSVLPGWGNVTPWILRSGDQFRPAPPPALGSEEYARDYNEIKEIGALNSPTRTAEQTQIATFWLASALAVWSQPLDQVNAANDFDLSSRARAFALVYLASAETSIACWDGKYYYNFWRPLPAIRRGDEDGNDATEADSAWTPLHTTPPHPEYPSGHTTISSGMATILRLVYGDKPGMPIFSTIGTITRRWDNFEEGLDEVIEARIYSGIHFRTADEVGSKLGGQVARFVFTHALRPCRGKGARCFRD